LGNAGVARVDHTTHGQGLRRLKERQQDGHRQNLKRKTRWCTVAGGVGHWVVLNIQKMCSVGVCSLLCG
jgi:hypothetical protein